MSEYQQKPSAVQGRIAPLDGLRATKPAEGELQVRLRDGTAASAGDPLVTRRNNRHLPFGPSGWVKNGDRWLVHAVLPDGRLRVVHDDTRRHLTLPAAYVAEHVQLGYATTIHLAQGRTTDTAHVLLSGRESREALYVAMTRGRAGNHLYLDPTPADDPDAGSRPDVIAPPTSTELLGRILATVDARPSATSTAEVEPDPAVRLRTAITRYTEALTHTPRTHAETRAGTAADRPLPWLPAPPTGGDADWDAYLRQRAALITDLATQVDTTSAGRHLPGGPWADQLHHHAPALAAELAVWRAAHDIPAREPTLYATTAPDPGGYQQQLAEQIRAAVGDPPTACERWKPLVDSISPAIATDPTFWPDLADAFTRADELGIDVPARLHQAASRADLTAPDPNPAWSMYLRIGGNGFPDLIPHDHNHARAAARAPDPAHTVSRPITYQPTPTHTHTPSPGGHRR